MTKKELIRNLRVHADLTHDQAARAVNCLFDDISNTVTSGEPVYIPKFGKFYVSKMAEKRCKHPKTKEEVITPEHPIVRFRMAEEMKRRLIK